MADVPATIKFEKTGNSLRIIDQNCDLDISAITDMQNFIFEKTNFLAVFVTEDGIYNQIGSIEKKRIKYYAYTKGILRES